MAASGTVNDKLNVLVYFEGNDINLKRSKQIN